VIGITLREERSSEVDKAQALIQILQQDDLPQKALHHLTGLTAALAMGLFDKPQT
jgi:hypothetical protein